MQEKRINLYNKYRDNASNVNEFDKKYSSYSKWASINFKDKTAVNGIWNKSLKAKDKKNRNFWDDTEDLFYKTFACDLEWAKNTVKSCGGSEPKKDDCKTLDKKYTDKGYTITFDVEVFRRAKNKGIYYTAYYDCKNDGKKHYFYKLKGTTPPDPDDDDIIPGPSPDPTSYRDCTGGPYTIGCKSTDGVIEQVQGCLGVTADGKFGPKTEEALRSKVKKNTFTKDEADGICSGKLDDQSGSKPFGVEEQRTYWQELKDNKQITDRGVTFSIKNGSTITYVYKQNKDTKVKELVDKGEINWSTPEKKDALMKNFETYDYVVLYPINPNDPKTALDNVEVITAIIDPNGETNIGRVKGGTWSPSEKQTSFEDELGEGDLVSETIKKILSRRLVEQNVTLTRGSSPDPKGGTYSGGQTTSGGNQASTTSGGGQTPTKINVDDETIKIMTPIKERALKVIDAWDDYNKGLKGLSPRLGIKKEVDVQIDGARSTIQSTDPKDFCKKETDINRKKTDLRNNKKKYALILTDQDDSYITQLEGLLGQLLSGCKKISSMSSGGQTTTTTTTSNQTPTTSGGQQQPTSSPSSSQTNSIDPKLKEFVESNGYTFDKPGLDEESQLATQTTVGELLKNLDRYKIYVDYYKDTTPVWKSSYSEGEEVDLDSLIEDAKSADSRSEDSRRACRGVVKQLYYRAFKSKRIIQFRDLEDLTNEKLQELKNAVIKCDEDKNFVEGSLGTRDELKSLYSCYQSGRDKRERHGISKYCLTGYMEKVQNTPGMQRESIVKKHILNAINNKKKDVMVESILSHIKNTRR
jgi:hypothetical protein